jgi:hypothetical protein
LPILVWVYFLQGEIDHQSHARPPSLINYSHRQDDTGIWSSFRTAKRCKSHREPVFPRRKHCAHRTAGLATILILSDRQSPSSHLDAMLRPWLGHRASDYGCSP